jgi:CheY-like chemotaxis protein
VRGFAINLPYPAMIKQPTLKNIVFYADDDVDDLELVQDAFNRYTNNVEVVTAKDGVQALSYLKSLNDHTPTPCLIILDINMPVLNGRDVLKKIKEMPPLASVPVVLFSTSSSTMDKEFAKKYEAGFITKPLDVSQMEMITELFVEHCRDEIKRTIRKRLQ